MSAASLSQSPSGQPARFPWRFFLFWWAVTALPFLAGELVPGVDGPAHLSTIEVLRLGLTDHARFMQTYDTHLLQPYWGFYAPVLLLSAVMSVAAASRLVLFVSACLPPLAFHLLAREEGSESRLSLLAFALVFNFSFYFGFYPFYTTIGFALLALVCSVRFARHGTVRRWFVLQLISIGLFIGHTSAWSLWFAWSLWIVVTEGWPLNWKRIIGAFSTCAVPVGCLVAWRTGVDAGYIRWVREHPLQVSLTEKLARLADYGFPSFGGLAESLIGLLFFAALLLAWRQSRFSVERKRLVRWGGIAGFMLLAYFIVPQDFGGWSFVYQRFITYCFLFLLLCVPPMVGSRRAFLAVASVVVVLNMLVTTLMFRRFNEEMADGRRALAQTTPGSSLMGLMVDNQLSHDPLLETSYPFFLHVDDYHTMWKLGRVYTHSMNLFATSPVVYRERREAVPGFEWSPVRFDYDRMGQDTDYFLIRGPEEMQTAQGVPVPMDPRVLKQSGLQHTELVFRSPYWRLYRRRPDATGAPAAGLPR